MAWVHRLSNLDVESRVADCANCGVIDVRPHRRGRKDGPATWWRCGAATRAEQARRRGRPTGIAAARRGRLKKYRMSEEDYAALLALQGGGCAICGTPPAPGRELGVDHNHSCCPGIASCGECIRGLLCRFCNLGIGNLQDSPPLLEAAIAYLHKTSTRKA